MEAACRRFRCYECQRLRLDHAAAAAHAALAVATVILAARGLEGRGGGGSDGWDGGSSWDVLEGAAGGMLLQPAAAAQELLQGLPAACLLLGLALVPALVLPAVLLELVGPQAGARCACVCIACVRVCYASNAQPKLLHTCNLCDRELAVEVCMPRQFAPSTRT